ncbi:MAG: enoyl-CoA hydratase/isomerase family protein, partial [Alphaproteobacteria bacterium]
NRPEARNALSEEMRGDFDKLLPYLQAEAGRAVKAVVLTGAGPAFSAGGDIKGMRSRAEATPADSRRRMRASHHRMYDIGHLELPVIAAVDGAAAGAGFCLALAADFIVATPRARFAASFNRIGLVPDWAGLYYLPRLVGLQKAKELVFTCRLFGAEEAKQMGIVYDIWPQEGFLDRAKAFAGRFRGASTEALGMSKNLLNQSFETDFKTMLELEAMAQSVARGSSYHTAAVARFVEKQPPLFNWEAMEKEAAAD